MPLSEEPLVTVLGFMDTEWDNTSTVIDFDPRFSTGWWDWGRDGPLVTVTNPNASPVLRGSQPTGYDFVDGAGGVGQRYVATCLVNGWAGTFDSLAGEGPAGGDVSPKVLAWDMCQEIRRILLLNPEGTTDGSGSVELTSIAPGTHRRIADNDPDLEYPTLFRYEVECRYTFTETG